MERVGVPRTPMGLWIMLILYLRIRPQTIVGRLPKIPHGERRMCAICCGGGTFERRGPVLDAARGDAPQCARTLEPLKSGMGVTMETNDPTAGGVYLDDDGRILAERHRRWWAREGGLMAWVSHSSLGELWLPLSDGTLATQDLDLTPDMLDLERLAGDQLEPGPLERNGDQFVTVTPYTRVPWVEAILGCPVRATIQGGSMRTRSFVADWDAWHARDGRLHEGWFDALKQLTVMLAERGAGRYAVAQTLMRGPSDLAEAILGPELMCLSMYDHPRALRGFLETVTEAFVTILNAQLERIPRVQGGYVNPFGIWAPGTVVRTQCDASAFLSPAQYKEWFLPYDERISEAVGYATIHLHSGSLHTVPALLEVERPQAIQVTLDPEPSAPPTLSLIPTFRRILEAKPVIIDGPLTAEEVHVLEQELPVDGRCVLARHEPW